MEKYTFASNIGNITVIYSDDYIEKIVLNSKDEKNETYNKFAHKIEEEILYYLNKGKNTVDIPYLIKGTDFEVAILNEVSKIEYGKTISYKELSKRAGYPNAYRACGTVCKNNVLPILIPCHRVIKSDGSLGEYNGGKQTKKFLVELEKNYKNC